MSDDLALILTRPHLERLARALLPLVEDGFMRLEDLPRAVRRFAESQALEELLRQDAEVLTDEIERLKPPKRQRRIRWWP